MDVEKVGKSNTEMGFRPNRLMAFFHLVVGVFMFFGLVLVFNALSLALAGLYLNKGFTFFLDPTALDFLMDDVGALRIIVVIGSSLSMFLAGFVALKVVKADIPTYMSMDYFPSAKWILLSLIFFLFALPLSGWLLEVNRAVDFSGKFPELYEMIQNSETRNESIYLKLLSKDGSWQILINVFVMAIFPAIAEEFFFRGFLMKTFFGWFRNIHVAIVVTGVLFAVLHLQFLKFLPMVLLASVFGYIVYWTRSIWPAVIAHALNNTFAIFAYYQKGAISGDSAVLSNEFVFPVWLVIISGTVFLLIAYSFSKNSPLKLNNFYE